GGIRGWWVLGAVGGFNGSRPRETVALLWGGGLFFGSYSIQARRRVPLQWEVIARWLEGWIVG
ncbi:MAG TPA: hypothetical protein PLN52_25550, partial [Opitutaceae bacterium]|nr:hypothetical protein [Opitutaceae bacterium]